MNSRSTRALLGVLALGGPIKIPHLIRDGPMFFLNYQWTRNRNDSNATGLMPTVAERNGDLSEVPVQVINPATGAPIPGNLIPKSLLSPQAQALLRLDSWVLTRCYRFATVMRTTVE